MHRLLTKAILYLCNYHYEDNDQREHTDSLIMNAMDHPCRGEYEALWSLFLSSPVACGPGQRYLVYRNRKNYIKMSRPRLTVVPFIGSPVTVRSAYLLAQAGWPDSSKPGVDLGTLELSTDDPVIIDQLTKVLGYSPPIRHRKVLRFMLRDEPKAMLCDHLRFIQDYWPVEDHQVSLPDHIKEIEQSTRTSAIQENNTPEPKHESPESPRLTVNIDEIDEATKRRDTWI